MSAAIEDLLSQARVARREHRLDDARKHYENAVAVLRERTIRSGSHTPSVISATCTTTPAGRRWPNLICGKPWHFIAVGPMLRCLTWPMPFEAWPSSRSMRVTVRREYVYGPKRTIST
jgi:hypothetical protein